VKDPDFQQLYDLVFRDQEYTIYYQDRPLKTRCGNLFSHTNDRLMRHLLTDFQNPASSNKSLNPALIFEFQLDHASAEHDFILKEFDLFTKQDPFIQLKTAGNKGNSVHAIPPEKMLSAADDISLDLAFWSFSSILKNLNLFIEEHIAQTDLSEDNENPLILLIRQQYNQLPPEKKAVMEILTLFHHSGLILPLLFVHDRITASEYAKGVLALNMRNPDQLTLPTKQAILEPYAGLPETNNLQPEYNALFHDGSLVIDYLSYFSLPVASGNRTQEMIAAGESSSLEFKSTLRWDLRAGKTNPAIERASLKTVCAFLNTSGGMLLIGVRDDGSIEGIESDKLANDDRFLLHLWTLIRTCLGKDVSPYIQTNLDKINDRTVCVVTCSRSLRPVFLRQPGFDEEFYIRLGPSSASLDISEALKYIADRF
jgi:hypothetical protein